MSGGFGEEASRPTTQSSSFSNNNGSNNGDGGNFECSICLDLAQDPVVTLCGHLFCWPCIYKWLHMPSRSQECPMCKASIEEQKLVPLYGRGKTPGPTDASSESESVPNRPAGQRPETSRQRNRNAYHHVQHQHGSGLIGGFGPAFTATYGNFTFSFGGFIPSIFSVHMHALNGPHMYGNGGHELRHHRDHHHEVSPLIDLFHCLWRPRNKIAFPFSSPQTKAQHRSRSFSLLRENATADLLFTTASSPSGVEVESQIEAAKSALNFMEATQILVAFGQIMMHLSLCPFQQTIIPETCSCSCFLNP